MPSGDSSPVVASSCPFHAQFAPPIVALAVPFPVAHSLECTPILFTAEFEGLKMKGEALAKKLAAFKKETTDRKLATVLAGVTDVVKAVEQRSAKSTELAKPFSANGLIQGRAPNFPRRSPPQSIWRCKYSPSAPRSSSPSRYSPVPFPALPR